MARILIVEDNPTARKMFRLTLEAEGYGVVEASDGRSALEQVAREIPALVLQDLVLPDRDGIALAREIRSLPGCADVPIVMMSGFPRLLEDARAEPGCFDAALIKPVSTADLVNVVQRYLPAPMPTSDTFGRGKSMLIVDDDLVQLKLARLRFADVGFDVTTVTDASSALAAAQKRPPDVVLCDVLMPDTDGYELCVALRGIAELAATQVVLISAHYGGTGDEELARAAGACALVMRTPTMQETLDAVRESLARDNAATFQDPDFGKHHAERVIAQLKRQVRFNAGIAERAALQTAQLSVLAGVADALARSSDMESALADVLAACLDAGGVSRGALFRVDDQDRLKLSIAMGFPEADGANVEQIFGFPSLLDLTDRGSIVTPRDHLSPEGAKELFERAGVAALVIVPIMDGHDRIGALMLGTNLGQIGTTELATFGRAIGAHIAQALALTSAFTRQRDAADASQILSASLDMRTTLISLGELATRRLAHLCEVCIGSEPTVVPGATLPAKSAAALAALRTRFPGRAVLPHDVIPMPGQRSVVISSPEFATEDEQHRELVRALGVVRQIVVPLVRGGHHLGTISFARVGTARPFREADVVVAEDLAHRAAIAIENARLYESARAVNRAKDEFLGTLSHELRSPLNAVLGWVQLLSHGLPGAKWAKAVEAIERNAKAQAALIDDLLDMSRIVSGVMRIEGRPIELRAIVETTIDSLKPQIDAKGIILRRMSLRRTPLVGDESRLQQVICNLLGNAIKFTPAGGHIDISLAEVNGKVSLSIADDGKGIDPRFLPHVFERFKQADGSPARAHGGLGLGLAISRHLVELHGGTIVAESAGEGRGTQITVTLPTLALAAAVDSGSGTDERAEKTGALHGLAILVVDDEPDTREMFVVLLEQYGASVTAVCSAAEALAAVARVRPDIMLSDLGMPGEDGYSLIRKLRAHPTTEVGAIPAIAVSGFAAAEDRQRALAAGFQMHVTKPVNVPDLLLSITSLRPPGRA